MSILVYAFESFGRNKSNISEEVLIRLKNKVGLTRVVFPVEFNQKIYTDAISSILPSVIVGLGQYPRGKKLRIERRATNLKRSHRYEKPTAISRNGPKYLAASLKLKPNINSRISYNAGKYVCNFSMYVISKSLTNSKTRYGFIHIPKNYNVTEAVKFVESKLKEISFD